jgi:hypothetical protein
MKIQERIMLIDAPCEIFPFFSPGWIQDVLPDERKKCIERKKTAKRSFTYKAD